MAEPTWTLYLDDSFQRADTSVGSGPDSNTGVPGAPTVGAADNWYDEEGNNFRIQGNQLERKNATISWGGTALRRGAGESFRDQRLLVDFPVGHKPGALYVRFNATTTGSLWFNCVPNGFLGFLSAFGGFQGQTGSFAYTYDATKAYQADCKVWGASPTNWRFTLTNTTDNTVVLDTSGTTSSGATTAGVVGVDAGGNSSFGRLSRVRAYSGEYSVGEPVPVATSITLSQTALSWPATVGGTPPVTLALHRSTDPVATLGAGTLVADVTAVTPGTTYTDAPGGAAGTQYYYWLRATDSSTPTPSLATSFPLPLSTKIANFKIGLVGDSITAGPSLEQISSTFAAMYPKYTLTATNKGAPGTASGDWLPAGVLLTPAINDFTSAGVTHVCVMLGTNDARDAVAATPATFKSNLSAMCNALVAAGFKVILNAPPCYRLNFTTTISAGGHSAASYALLPQYVAKLDELVNGATIYKGDRQAFAAMAEKANTLFDDWVHPNVAGRAVLLSLWWEALGPVLGLTAASGGGGGGAAVGRIFGGL